VEVFLLGGFFSVESGISGILVSTEMEWKLFFIVPSAAEVCSRGGFFLAGFFFFSLSGQAGIFYYYAIPCNNIFVNFAHARIDIGWLEGARDGFSTDYGVTRHVVWTGQSTGVPRKCM
jgi:hypothetical protein